MKKLFYSGLASLSLGLYCLKPSLSEHPQGFEVQGTENLLSSFVCTNLIEEVRSNISDVKVFYFENRSKGVRSKGFFTNAPFFVKDRGPRIYLSLDNFDEMQSTCFHESFHAYLSLSESNLNQTYGFYDLKNYFFVNSNLISNLFLEFDFENKFKNQHVRETLQNLYESYPNMSVSEFLEKFEGIANLISKKFRDSDDLDDRLMVKRINFALYNLKYLLSDDELIARLFTSYFYDIPDSYYALSKKDLSRDSVFMSYLKTNFPELIADSY